TPYENITGEGTGNAQLCPAAYDGDTRVVVLPGQLLFSAHDGQSPTHAAAVVVDIGDAAFEAGVRCRQRQPAVPDVQTARPAKTADRHFVIRTGNSPGPFITTLLFDVEYTVDHDPRRLPDVSRPSQIQIRLWLDDRYTSVDIGTRHAYD